MFIHKSPLSVRLWRRPALIAMIVGIAVVSVACGSSESSAPEPLTDEFATNLFSTAQGLPVGDSIALNEMTEFEWDNVHIFAPGTIRSEINDTVGAMVYDSDLDRRYGVWTDRFLAVFTLDGSVASYGEIPESFFIEESPLSSTAKISRIAVSGGQRVTLSD